MRRTTATVSALVLLTLAACGGSDDGTIEDGSGDAVTTPAAGTDGATPADTASPSDTVAPSDTAAPADTEVESTADDGGFCNVRVTGDVTAEWTSPGGYSAIGYGPWIDTSQGTIAGMPLDATFFILNCSGEGDNSLNFGANVDVSIPMTPATYTIPTTDNAFGGSDTPSEISVLVSLDGTDTNWGLSEPGTLEITKFDETGIAGTFRLVVTDILARIPGGGPSKGDAVVEGEFDYANPNP